MRVFLIGGTGFTGPALVRQLLDRGHEVTCLHRGQTHDPRTHGAEEILVDRHDASALTRSISGAAPDVVVDMISFVASDADATRAACRNVVSRVVALSSIDVYWAYGRIKGTEVGPLQSTPLTETSVLRTTNPDGANCDNVAVERSFRADGSLSTTILRLPAIYGPRDRYRRTRGYLKRMEDGRETILLGETVSEWKFSRGYVDNVAHGIVLAIENDVAAGQVYNVGEPRAMTELEFVRAIGTATGWEGEVRIVPDGELPAHLQSPVDFRQNWNVDTRKIREELRYTEVVDIPEAYRRTVDWERANPPDVEPFEYDYEQEDAVIGK